METVLELAETWLEHCREEADYFYKEGEDDTAEKWRTDAEEAEKIIEKYVDTWGRGA